MYLHLYILVLQGDCAVVCIRIDSMHMYGFLVASVVDSLSLARAGLERPIDDWEGCGIREHCTFDSQAI